MYGKQQLRYKRTHLDSRFEGVKASWWGRHTVGVAYSSVHSSVRPFTQLDLHGVKVEREKGGREGGVVKT